MVTESQVVIYRSAQPRAGVFFPLILFCALRHHFPRRLITNPILHHATY